MSDSESLFTGHDQWNPDLEQVVKKEGEQSQSLYWLHNYASIWASKKNDIIQIPAIVLASVTGFLSATSVLVPPIGIGAMSLAVGVLSTIASYYRFSQRSESHRMVSLLYLKTYKHIDVELALPVQQRVNARILLAELRQTMARLSEIAPPIPSSAIDKYNRVFKNSPVSSPVVTKGIEVITVCLNEIRENSIEELPPPPPIDEPKIVTRSWPSVSSQTDVAGIRKK